MVNASLVSTTDSKKDHGGVATCAMYRLTMGSHYQPWGVTTIAQSFWYFRNSLQAETQYFFEVALPHILLNKLSWHSERESLERFDSCRRNGVMQRLNFTATLHVLYRSEYLLPKCAEKASHRPTAIRS